VSIRLRSSAGVVAISDQAHLDRLDEFFGIVQVRLTAIFNSDQSARANLPEALRAALSLSSSE